VVIECVIWWRWVVDKNREWPVPRINWNDMTPVLTTIKMEVDQTDFNDGYRENRNERVETNDATERPKFQRRPDGRSIYVGNLPFRDEYVGDGVLTRQSEDETKLIDDIRGIFERYGQLADVYVPRDYYSKRIRGFAYVQYVC
jgi:hypothetical protein